MSDEKQYIAEVVDYNGVKTVKIMVDFIEAINKAIPNLEFKPNNKKTHYLPDELKGSIFCFDIFDKTDLKNPLGKIGVEPQHEIYYITNKNINMGRYNYSFGEYSQQSKHLKNVVKIAKKTIKPMTIWQVADNSYRGAINAIEHFGEKVINGAIYNTSRLFPTAYEDLKELYAIGYQPKNPDVANAIKYIIDNLEQIEKYHNYKPKIACVWVKANGVDYSFTDDKDKVFSVESVDKLPEDFVGKMSVLDILNNKDAVEDIGLKTNDNIYWLIA